MGNLRCKALCARFPKGMLCKDCLEASGAPYGTSFEQLQRILATVERTVATPSGTRGTVRQKFQNRSFRYMRVKPGPLAQNYRLLALKQKAGELRFDEENARANARDATDASWTEILRARR